MKKNFTIVCLALASTSFYAQVALTAVGVAVTENFDSMSTALPTGWSAYRSAGTGVIGQALSPTVDNGSASSGGIYNVGTASASDRALGSIGSGSTSPAYGAQLMNSTGSAMTSLNISFTQEQWKTGSNASANEVVTFEYSTNAASLDGTATWIPVAAGNLTEILTASTVAAAVNGNLPANQLAKSFAITGLNIPNGGSIWIRWTDSDDFGSDCMLAVDNISFTAQGGSLAVSDFNKSKSDFIKNTFVKNEEITFGTDVKDVKVYTLSGQVVKTASVKEGASVNVAELAKGNYIVTGTVNNRPVSQKILKD